MKTNRLGHSLGVLWFLNKVPAHQDIDRTRVSLALLSGEALQLDDKPQQAQGSYSDAYDELVQVNPETETDVTLLDFKLRAVEGLVETSQVLGDAEGTRYHASEALEIVQGLLERYGRTAVLPAKYRFLKGLGDVQAASDQPDQARESYARAKKAAVALAKTDPSHVAKQMEMSLALGDIALMEGDIGQALTDYLDIPLRALRAGGDRAPKSKMTYIWQEYQDGMEEIQQALREQLWDDSAPEQGDMEPALDAVKRNPNAVLPDMEAEKVTQRLIQGDAAYRDDHYHSAAFYYADALRQLAEVTPHEQMPFELLDAKRRAYEGMGNVAMMTDKYQDAVTHYNQGRPFAALMTRVNRENAWCSLRSWNNIGHLRLVMGDYPRAFRAYRTGLEQAAAVGRRHINKKSLRSELITSLKGLAAFYMTVFYTEPEREQALRWNTAALKLHHRHYGERNPAQTGLLKQRRAILMALGRGGTDKAIAYYDQIPRVEKQIRALGGVIDEDDDD